MVMVWDLRNGKKVTGVPVFEAVEGLVSLPKDADFPGLPPAKSSDWSSLQKKKGAYFATVGMKDLLIPAQLVLLTARPGDPVTRTCLSCRCQGDSSHLELHHWEFRALYRGCA